MSSNGSCDGFLTLNQSILVVVISSAVVVIALIVIAIVSVQYHNIAKRSRQAETKGINQPNPNYFANNQALPMTSPLADNDQLKYEEIFRRKSLIPRPQVEAGNPYFASMPQQAYTRSQSLPVNQPNQPKTRPAQKKIVDQSTAQIRKAADKPRDESTRPTTNRQNAPQQPQKAASGMKIPMQPQRKIPADIPEEPIRNDYNYADGSEREWSQNQMQTYKPQQDKVAKKSYWEATAISDNFILQAPDQSRMMNDRYA